MISYKVLIAISFYIPQSIMKTLYVHKIKLGKTWHLYWNISYLVLTKLVYKTSVVILMLLKGTLSDIFKFLYINFSTILYEIMMKPSTFLDWKMKSTLILVVLGTIVLFGGTVNAWGGLFNRFSPEMLANFVEDPQHRPYSQVNICLCNNFIFFYFYFLFLFFLFVVCFNVVINVIGVLRGFIFLKRIRMFLVIYYCLSGWMVVDPKILCYIFVGWDYIH